MLGLVGVLVLEEELELVDVLGLVPVLGLATVLGLEDELVLVEVLGFVVTRGLAAELLVMEDELELVDALGSAVVLGLVPIGLLFSVTAALAGNASKAVNRYATVRHTAIFFISPSPQIFIHCPWAIESKLVARRIAPAG